MRGLLAIPVLLAATLSHAHQPVMDMAPRWANGYGVQLRYEEYGSSDLMRGADDLLNPLGFERFVNTTWLEGVYTFDRSVRLTAKIPFVDQRRVVDLNGLPVNQSTSGLGDIVIGLPLKRYSNQRAVTQNWSLTPSLRIPTGSSSGDFPISDGSWDAGLSLGFSRETPKFYQLYDLYFWKEGSGKRGMQTGDSFGLDINLGIHPWHSNETNSGIFLMWDVSAKHSDAPNQQNLTTAAGGDRVYTGPVFVAYRQNLMFRAEYKVLAYEHVDNVGLSRGNQFSLSVGVTF